jgi:hypothetical protein
LAFLPICQQSPFAEYPAPNDFKPKLSEGDEKRLVFNRVEEEEEELLPVLVEEEDEEE